VSRESRASAAWADESCNLCMRAYSQNSTRALSKHADRAFHRPFTSVHGPKASNGYAKIDRFVVFGIENTPSAFTRLLVWRKRKILPSSLTPGLLSCTRRACRRRPGTSRSLPGSARCTPRTPSSGSRTGSPPRRAAPPPRAARRILQEGPSTDPTATLAMLLPVPHAMPCATMPMSPPAMPPPDCCWCAGGGAPPAGRGGGARGRGAATRRVEKDVSVVFFRGGRISPTRRGWNDGGPRVERASRAYQACVHHHRHRGDPFRSSWSVVELRGAGDCGVAPGGSTREMISTTSGDRH